MKKHGDPFWIDLATHDLAGAGAFYREVFGWELIDDHGYLTAASGGHPVAGMMSSLDEDGSPVAPTAWAVAFRVDDLDATVSRVEAAGGSVEFEPMDLGAQGRQAHCLDATGAYVVFWEAGEFDGFPDDFPVRFELLARDFAGARAFYSAVLGSDELVSDARSLPISDGSTWRIHFLVDSVDDVVQRVVAAGGLLAGPAEVSDPQGAHFLLQERG